MFKNLTIQELIDILEQYDPNTLIYFTMGNNRLKLEYTTDPYIDSNNNVFTMLDLSKMLD